MGKKVFANGREISAKTSANKCVGAMPDVCLSPPSPPAGPIPIPYPNFSKSKDLADGSKKVKIGGKPVCLKNKSNYKKSKGDSAATRNFGMGVVSHKLEGGTANKSWSFDVKVEGENACRHLDMTSHNHGSSWFNLALATNLSSGNLAVAYVSDMCSQLKIHNEDQRERLNHQKESTTISHGAYVKGNQVKKMVWSCSRAIGKKYRNGVAEGIKYQRGLKRSRDGQGKSDVKGGADGSNIKCGEQRGFKYKATKSRSGVMPHTSHTESRIIEKLFEGSNGNKLSGTLLLAIDWRRNKGAKKLDIPCKHCKRLICAAMLCGLKIVLCKEKGPEKQNKDECKEDLSK